MHLCCTVLEEEGRKETGEGDNEGHYILRE
jgi:hypothetical protein